MTIDSIDINAAIREIEKLLANDKDHSPALESAIKMLILVVKLMGNRLGLNSANSSKPPSSDPNRKKKRRAKENLGNVAD